MTHGEETSFSCDPCRRRRRKCDRRTPACSLCEKRNDECVYDPTRDQRRLPQRDYAAALEARVVLLEGILRNAGVKDVAGPSGLASIDQGDTGQVIPPPVASTQLGTKLEARISIETGLGFVPSDDAAQALVPIIHPNPGEVAASTIEEIDLGMSGYVPLMSLDMEHRLLSQFWDWQRIHLPYVAPVPFLSAYALCAQFTHPDEPTPPPSSLPANPLPDPSATDPPSAESVHAAPELAQFISPLLLDAMLGVAALFHGNTELSNQFYKRAESRVMGEAANPRLATVQGVQLMAIIVAHARAPAAWTLNGVAVALCVRLGMHVDATPLVRCGALSKKLFETRNFVFWTTYSNDRLYAICLGMHPLMDRRIISTPRHSSLPTANIIDPAHPEPGVSVARPSSTSAEKPTASDVGTTWWSPATLGMGDVIVQAGWEALRDLARLLDTVYDGIYSFDAPKRTPQQDLELVARNNLMIQRFLDELPAWMRSTDGIRTKFKGTVYLHLFIHLVSILACRPFLSPRPLSEDAMRLDATTDTSQPTHSSHIIRRYRTLAFRIARASALQITSLIRYIPPSSPCVATPYLIYSACTILLLVPNDTVAMSGVRTAVASLDSMSKMGHGMNSMKDTRERVLALAKRWGVDIEQGKRVHGLVLRGSGGTSEPSRGESDGTESDDAESSDAGSGVQKSRGSSNRIGGCATRPIASTLTYDGEAESGATYGYMLSGWTQQYGDDPLAQMYAGEGYSECIAPAPNDAYTALLPQQTDITAALDVHCTTMAHSYGAWDWTMNSYSDAGEVVQADESVDGSSHAPQQQPYASTPSLRLGPQTHGVGDNHSGKTYSGFTSYESQAHFPTRHRIHLQEDYPHYHHESTPSAPLPHAAYALSHVDPLYESHLPQTHWHQILPPADPNLPFPPDPVSRIDPGVCLADTQKTQAEPVFVWSAEDLYAGVAVDWLADMGRSLPAITIDTCAGSIGAGSSIGVGIGAPTSAPLNGGLLGVHVQGAESGSYRQKHPLYGCA
ncbi:hypothetical protein BDV93DRAFT_519498 [Ceratobasidium sp. AG-I]|nr:hypothetical protein BDV93DRAFT_519498 [Ceratobasidium sp. AG-I]